MNKAVLQTSLVFFVVLIPSLSNIKLAQGSPRNTDHQFNNWFNPSLNIRANKYVGFYIEGQLRFNEFKYNQQHQIRGMLDVFLTKTITVSPIGYVYTWNYQYGKQPAKTTENLHCIFEQISVKHSVGRVFFEQRARMEQRWQEHKVLQNDGSYLKENFSYKNRFRYRTMITIPLNKKTMCTGTIFVSTWDEMFVSFGKNVNYNLPDQNRVYVGLGYKFNKKGTVQLGYLNQLLIKKEGTKAESNHTLFLGFNYVVDFTKKRDI